MGESLEGRKDDRNKTRYDLLPAVGLHEVARVSTFGAVKYADRNWEKGMKWGRIFAALMRHAWAWMRGETYDPETGLHHMAHAAWCCMVLVDYETFGIGDNDLYTFRGKPAVKPVEFGMLTAGVPSPISAEPTPPQVICATCGGSGSVPSRGRCPTCKGLGVVPIFHRNDGNEDGA